jgi:hypothetical protein
MQQEEQNGPQQERLFSLYQDEYNKLKAEQASRIGFRDNLLYVTLGVVGGVFAYAFKEPGHVQALLLIPWACFILGWTYLMNDRAISAIGRYVRNTLTVQLETDCGVPRDLPFRWEVEHRTDDQRIIRKLFQLVVDLMAFCLSSSVALVVFVRLVPAPSGMAPLLIAFGWLMTLVLAGYIIWYADVSK